jgi:uncharacterized protein YrrD
MGAMFPQNRYKDSTHDLAKFRKLRKSRKSTPLCKQAGAFLAEKLSQLNQPRLKYWQHLHLEVYGVRVMSLSTQPYRHSDLINRLVLERQTADTIGHLDHLGIDPQEHQVSGLVAKSGLLRREKHYFAWSQVETIGDDGIFVNGQADQTEAGSRLGKTVIGYELWTNTGSKVGKIVDYLFNSETSKIQGYLYASNGWQGVVEGIYLLEPVAVSSVGEKRVIALEAAVQRAQQYSPGVQEKVEKAKGTLAQDYTQTKQDMEGVLKQVQTTAQEVQKNLQSRFSDEDPDPDPSTQSHGEKE